MAFTDVAGVFAMTTMTTERGTEGEVEHGTAIADAAAAAGVPHVVDSSVGGAERHTGIPHFESKRRVEEHFESLGLSTTFVRPTFFMDNFIRYSRPQIENGTLVLRMPLPGGVPVQMIATDDVGTVSAAALLDPDIIGGKSIEIAGDELTGEQVAAVHGEHAGLPARYEPVPLDVLAADPDQQAMFAWFAHPPAYQADFVATKRIGAHRGSSRDLAVHEGLTLTSNSSQIRRRVDKKACLRPIRKTLPPMRCLNIEPPFARRCPARSAPSGPAPRRRLCGTDFSEIGLSCLVDPFDFGPTGIREGGRVLLGLHCTKSVRAGQRPDSTRGLVATACPARWRPL